MIDSNWLASFSVFAEERHFTRAAQRLHISQPALHVQIAKLSQQLGVKLYRRIGRALELTSEGQELGAFAREMSERSDAFLSTLRAAPSSKVVLAAGEGTLLYTLGPVVQRFSARADVKLRVLTRDRDGILAALSDGEAHLGVVPLATVPDGFAATKLWRSGQMLVLRRGHPLAKKRRIRLRDLQAQRLVLPPVGKPHREFVARALGAAGVSYEVSVEASGWELILRYAELGIGLAIVNDICRVPRGAVSRSLPELPSLDYYAVTRASREPSPATLELKASLQSLASKR